MRKILDLVSFIAFVIFTAVMFCILLFSKLPIDVRATSFSIICVNAVFAFIFFRKRSWLITLGLLFTLVSDYFLAFKDPTMVEKCVAMTTFSLAQISYGSYIALRSEKGFRNVSIIIRLSLSVAAGIIPLIVLPQMGSFASTDYYLASATFIYGLNLLLNFVFSIINFKKVPLLVFGFFLFICCDITVLLSAGNGVYFTVPTDSFFYQIIYSAFNITWMFYIPSQMLIVLSEIPCISCLFRKENSNKNA